MADLEAIKEAINRGKRGRSLVWSRKHWTMV